MREHLKELVNAVFCFWNPQIRWSSSPTTKKKPVATKFRMTVDARAVNAHRECVLCPMPMVELIFDHLQGSLAVPTERKLPGVA